MLFLARHVARQGLCPFRNDGQVNSPLSADLAISNISQGLSMSQFNASQARRFPSFLNVDSCAARTAYESNSSTRSLRIPTMEIHHEHLMFYRSKNAALDAVGDDSFLS